MKKDQSASDQVVADIEIYNKTDWENVPLVQKHFNPKSISI